VEYRTLGRTGLSVSWLGLGLAWIGFELTMDDQSVASEVLNTALDTGINFFDTASCYGISEELIGLTVPRRRREFYIATKCGHTSGDITGEHWTAETIRLNIDHSLRRMQTDYLDIIQLHSCSLEVLQKGEAIRAIQDAKQAGKVCFLGYSGDNAAAEWAVESGIFETLQTSFSLIDQKARFGLFQKARERNVGLIIKRPIGNRVWGAFEALSPYYEDYLKRAQAMLSLGDIPHAPDDPIRLAMGFTYAHEAVDTAIVGTKNPQHLRENIRLHEEGYVLPQSAIDELYRRFDLLGQDWNQLG